MTSLLLLLGLWLSSVSGAPLPLSLRWSNGLFFDVDKGPVVIGNLSSSLNAAVSAAFSSATGDGIDPSTFTLLNSNSKALSYLYLTGSLVVDVPLLVGGGCIVVLNDAVLQAADNFAGGALVIANESNWAAIVSPGGPTRNSINCATPNGIVFDGVRGVLALKSSNFLIDGLNVSNCGGINVDTCTAAVHFSGPVTGGTILRSYIQHSCRAVWVLSAQRIVVMGNTMFNNSKRTVDFDADASGGVVTMNKISGSAREAVVLQQGSQNIVVSGNTIGPDNGQGVTIFNNAYPNATKGHVIIGNLFTNNVQGAQFGSAAVIGSGTADALFFVNNVFSGNLENFVKNGTVNNTWLVENVESGGGAANLSSALLLAGGAQVAAFDPLGLIGVGAPRGRGGGGVQPSF